MKLRVAAWIAVGAFSLAAYDRQACAGQIHIRYEADAPEKMAAANAVYYQGVLNLAHNHPDAFAKDHPFYTKMFHDPVRVDKLLHRWEADEQRFEYWHNCLWKVLDGYLYTHPPAHLSSPGGGQAQLGTGGSPSSGGNAPQYINGGNPTNGGGSGPQGIHPFSVPEPSSTFLMITGLAILGARFRGRRRVAC